MVQMLAITRKPILVSVVFICACIIVFIVVICTSSTEEPTPRDIGILITSLSPMASPSVFLRITDEGVLKVISLPRIGVAESDFEVFDMAVFGDSFGYMISEEQGQRATLTGERQLSQRQLNNIWALADDVTPIHRMDEILGAGFYVAAFIDGEEYRTFFRPAQNHAISSSRNRNGHVNRNLIHLVYYLIDLSPVRLGIGE